MNVACLLSEFVHASERRVRQHALQSADNGAAGDDDTAHRRSHARLDKESSRESERWRSPPTATTPTSSRGSRFLSMASFSVRLLSVCQHLLHFIVTFMYEGESVSHKWL